MFRSALEPWHLLILVAVIVLLFGAKKVPDAARSPGKSMRILKSEAKAIREESGTTPKTASPMPGPPAPEAPHTIRSTPETLPRPAAVTPRFAAYPSASAGEPGRLSEALPDLVA
ncbi:Sec-independent protein translocase subunit TatA [Streptomyces violascens]|uniref:Sec-independent protein translocase subunit TatA n=1 Tax=Streptomyces violascens TaxID=67381 RepID=UPI0037992EC1